MPDSCFRTASPLDITRCHAIETAAYVSDEAATREKIARRINQYPDGFLVMEQNGQVIGFINSGCAHEVAMDDDAFKELVGHDPDAPHVVIMSVAIDPLYQGRGHASGMMHAFVRRMAAQGKASIHLMCKAHYVPLYQRLGFGYERPSASAYGGVAWHEMSMAL
jgi:ribosomal protein S18 acetylase RimI-like enzyme